MLVKNRINVFAIVTKADHVKNIAAEFVFTFRKTLVYYRFAENVLNIQNGIY